MRPHIVHILLVQLPLCFAATVAAQFVQQGPKLVGSGATGNASQGAVALSADGNTAIVGGNSDNLQTGAVWVWTRSGGVWTQQGGKLVGLGAAGSQPNQGFSVALSADANTALVGAPGDNNFAGAAWGWSRKGGVWVQEGNKLVGSGGSPDAQQGISVALSTDGSTVLVGGNLDNGGVGAAWVWTKTGGMWTQQGEKLVGSGAVGNARQGAVSLAADGNTAIVGGLADDNFAGAAWIWTRTGGVWTQHGSKLVGSGGSPDARQGNSVALSADGNTALVGGTSDSGATGAVWVWTRNGLGWTQQGSKLVGSDAVGAAGQGFVSLSADGDRAAVGGPLDNKELGAAWVWTRTASAWNQYGPKLVGSGASPGGPTPPLSARQGIRVSISADGNTLIVGGYRDNNFAGGAWIFVAATNPGPPRRRAIRH